MGRCGAAASRLRCVQRDRALHNSRSLIPRGRGTGPTKPRQPPHSWQVPEPARFGGNDEEVFRPMTSVLDRQPSHGIDRLNPATHLKCRHCGATSELAAIHVCERCFAPLEIGYDEELLARVTRESIEAGPFSLWRYVGLLPAGPGPGHRAPPGSR